MLNFEYKNRYDVADLQRLVYLLRQKDGCPWDSVQTHHSIRDNFLEEAYEVCEALDTENADLLREELGDVLLHVIFHASIEEEEGRYALEDIADSTCKKLIFRHPNLFGQKSSESWAEIKQREKGQKTHAQAMDSVARSLPSLWRAGKLQRHAANAGFDWSDASSVSAKAGEEFAELLVALATDGNTEEELGDLLFALVSVARHAGIDPERALHRASDKFMHRFAAAEQLAEGNMAQMSEDELVALWKRGKAVSDAAETSF